MGAIFEGKVKIYTKKKTVRGKTYTFNQVVIFVKSKYVPLFQKHADKVLEFQISTVESSTTEFAQIDKAPNSITEPSTTEKVDISQYIVTRENILKPLRSILGVFKISGTDYELYNINQEVNEYALALNTSLHSALFIPEGQTKGFWLRDIAKRSIHIRDKNRIIVAFRATSNLTIKIYNVEKKEFVAKFTVP